MKSFKRIFKYVWPQWPRVIVVFVSAIIVSSLLSLSIWTVIPLLKVMMGGEGLHGWAERKIVSHRYDIGFAVPTSLEYTDPNVGHHLLVIRVGEDSPAQKAGLQKLDVVVGADGSLAEKSEERTTRGELLHALATAPEHTEFALQIRRTTDTGLADTKTLTLHANRKPFYVDHVENLLTFLPREQTRQNRTKAVTFFVLAIGVVTVIRCLAKFYQEYMAQKVVQTAINDLRQDTFDHTLDIPVGFFANERPSDTVSRIFRDTTLMARAIKIMLGKALREPLNALFMIVVAMLLNWQLTLIFLCGVPFVLGLVATFGRKMKRASTKSLVAASHMLAKLQQTLAALKVVKVYNRHDCERQSFRTINERFLKQLLRISKVDAATTPTMEVLGMVAGAAALVVGAHWVTAGEMDGADFFGLLILLGVAAEAARKTSTVWNKIQEANAAAERVFAVIDTPAERDKPGATQLGPLREKIEFKNIVFTYPGMSEPILKAINLTVSAGHNVAIVGPNGAGKTTLANLIPRFYEPDSGQVLIDGVDIRDVTLRSLRDQIGMVTQNVVTFNDTIASNIGYGKREATREEIIAAAKHAFAHEFIDLLPNGYDTVIGEQGVGLSGGQLQRIIIARAILKDPPILIFDEATSQIDAESEAKIQQALEDIMQDRTTLIIAHRFSTVVHADAIVVMDEGKITAQGRHDELMEMCPLYQSLSETQLVKAR
jgi:ABC-type multidrug transport system fused ATPase/permease subunit